MKKEGLSRNVLVLIGVATVSLLILYFYFSSNNEAEVFYAPPPNTPPILAEIEDELFACEGSSFSKQIIVTDAEKDLLVYEMYPKYKVPFFIRKISSDEDVTTLEIYSGVLKKEQAGLVYRETIFVSDGLLSASAKTKINVAKINNPPQIKGIGVQTATLNNRFINPVIANDVETEELTFSVEFLTGNVLFGIGQDGVIDFTADSSYLGTHDIRVCASDSGISNPSPHIAQCGQDGSSQTSCEDFQLTVTEVNRPPTILSFSPLRFNSTVFGNDEIVFNISSFDPDGTTPDVYWTADGLMKRYTSGESIDTFTYAFGCGIKGIHTIKVEITDGLQNDSIQWDINVQESVCPPGARRGYTGEEDTQCQEKWACYDWGLCQKADQSFLSGLLSDSDYQIVLDGCVQNSWEPELCGFQIRDCFDLNACNTTAEMLPTISECHFALSPSCSDSRRNCHDESCEFLIDCGGPCADCPTCFDGLKNQGEEDIDCGSPCLKTCLEDKLTIESNAIKYTLLTILIVLIIVVAVLTIRIMKMKRDLKTSPDHIGSTLK